MKEDILEQLVDDYLQAQGYFTRHNLKFRPQKDHPDYESRKDCVHSDIDVLGIHPFRSGPDRVRAVSCKSWQGGFRPGNLIERLERDHSGSGRELWKSFRELVKPKWTEAFLECIQSETGSKQFTYVTAVTVVKGDKRVWETYQPFKDAIRGNPITV